MSKTNVLLSAALVITVGCSGLPTPQTNPTDTTTASTARGMQAPGDGDRDGSNGPARLEWADTLEIEAVGPFPVDLRSIPAGVYDPFNKMDTGRGGDRPSSPISKEEADRLRAEAMLLPPDERIGERLRQGPATKAATAGVSFDSLDFSDCCGGGGNVPPDTEIAVGPNHVIVVVNVAFEIYDKAGNVLSGPTTFSSFFAGTPGCSNAGVFDPNVAYDESADRFILGIDGDGTDYCVAATTGSDPLGTWNRYGFPTDFSGAFFDFPHIGVGNEAIYMGSNQFGGAGFLEARVFAMDKAALYAGTSMAVVTHSTGNDGTPQPAQLSGWNQGTWPAAGSPHYIMTEVFDGALHTVWSWSDPFGADVLTRLGDVNLNTATGVTAGLPVDWPQPGSSRQIQGNDWRGQQTQYRNGNLWMATNLACNPGGGTVNCVRWAQIDPVAVSVLDAGVLGTSGDYRTFPSVAANHCDDMMIGYTKGNGSMFPAVFIAGRENTDPPGTLQAETQIKAGEVTYTSFEASGAYRWGDYTKMAIDPDGVTFWYAGEYSKETGLGTKWGNYVGSFSFASCSVVPTVCGDGVIEGNEVCDGGNLGGATCGDQGCTGGSLTCNATCDGFDTSSCTGCPVCNNNFVCELGEDCFSCPTDCASGTTSGAVCGNGVCEAGNGEDCVSCAADCNGRQNGNPNRRYCCGDGGGQNPVACSDARCSASGNTCTDNPVVPGSFCCGDNTCDVGESCANCGLDCSLGFELCDNGVDDDCNGFTDCDDLACTGDPACNTTCGARGDSCSNNADCCSNNCRRNGRCR